MPCYSKVPTVLIDLAIIEQVAATLGIKVEKRTANAYTLRKDGEYITIEREREGEKFATKAYSGSSSWDTQIIPPLVQGYAKEQLKAFAKQKGYTVSAGNKPGEFVLVSYK